MKKVMENREFLLQIVLWQRNSPWLCNEAHSLDWLTPSFLIAGLAAVLWVSRYESAQTNTALGFELQSVAASVVGGVSISGGVGTVPGVMLGALLLGIIQNSLTLIRISPFWQLAAQGLLILIAVLSDKWILNRMERAKK